MTGLPIHHLTFRELRAANKARQLEWDGDHEFSELFFSNALGGEGGELAEVVLKLIIAIGKVENIVKKRERGRLGLPGSTATMEELAHELCDVLMYADLLANKVGIELDVAIIDKFNYVSNKYGMKTKLSLSPTTLERAMWNWVQMQSDFNSQVLYNEIVKHFGLTITLPD